MKSLPSLHFYRGNPARQHEGADSVANSAVQPGSPPRPILDAFFLPRGLLGRLGGRLMARGLAQQREIADLLPNPGSAFRPGVLHHATRSNRSSLAS